MALLEISNISETHLSFRLKKKRWQVFKVAAVRCEADLWDDRQFTPQVFQPYLLYVDTIDIYSSGWFCQAEQS